jgi:hypothetical protein
VQEGGSDKSATAQTLSSGQRTRFAANTELPLSERAKATALTCLLETAFAPQIACCALFALPTNVVGVAVKN